MKATGPLTFFVVFMHLLFVPVHRAKAQYLTGNLTDHVTNEPVIGAIIVVKGTSLSAATDAFGNFSLKAPSLPFFVVISSLGYVTQEFQVTTLEKPIRIGMKVDEESLQEV